MNLDVKSQQQCTVHSRVFSALSFSFINELSLAKTNEIKRTHRHTRTHHLLLCLVSDALVSSARQSKYNNHVIDFHGRVIESYL